MKKIFFFTMTLIFLLSSFTASAQRRKKVKKGETIFYEPPKKMTNDSVIYVKLLYSDSTYNTSDTTKGRLIGVGVANGYWVAQFDIKKKDGSFELIEISNELATQLLLNEYYLIETTCEITFDRIVIFYKKGI